MAARNSLLQRPQWVISNQLTMPLVTVNNAKQSVRGLVQVAIPITIFLDTLFVDKVIVADNGRSMQHDQFQIYKSIEGALQVTGIDGKACLLRTICEIQRNQLGSYTLAGELITLLLTPKSGEDGFAGFFHDYLVAEKVGRSLNESCADSFPRCPMSLSNFFSSKGNSGADDEANQASVNLNNNPQPKTPDILEHSHSSTTNILADHEISIEKDATSVRKKNPFGIDNAI